jgi:hypothetical protein
VHPLDIEADPVLGRGGRALRGRSHVQFSRLRKSIGLTILDRFQRRAFRAAGTKKGRALDRAPWGAWRADPLGRGLARMRGLLRSRPVESRDCVRCLRVTRGLGWASPIHLRGDAPPKALSRRRMMSKVHAGPFVGRSFARLTSLNGRQRPLARVLATCRRLGGDRGGVGYLEAAAWKAMKSNTSIF